MADTALKVNLLADITDLVSKMGTAKGEVSGAMTHMESAFGAAKTAFIGLLGVGSVGAFATMINGAINAQGALQDLATKTGASAAALDAFRVIGATSETSMDNVAAAMNKLGKNMVTGSADAAGAGVALKALGLDFDTIKNMKPEDQMLAIAGSMNQFADGADKGTTAQLLFGKAGADLLPFLKDLGGEAGNVTTALTEQEIAYRATQAAMSDAFGDNLTTIARETGQWKRDLAEGMTPALLNASTAFLSVATESGGMRDTINTMSRDGTFATWTQNTITGATYVMDAFSGLGTVVKSAGLMLGAWWAAISSGSWDGLKTVIKSVGDDLEATWGEKTLGQKLRDRMADTTAVGAATEASKPQLDVSKALKASEDARKTEKDAQREQEKAAKDLAKELKTQEEKYTSLKASIDTKITAMTAELELGTKLTPAMQTEIKYQEDLKNGVIKLTDEQKIEITTRIDRLKKVEADTAAAKEEKKQTDDNNASMQTSIEKMYTQTESIKDNTQKLKDEATQMGLSSGALYDLKLKRVDDQIAANNQKIAVNDLIDPSGKLSQQYKDQNDALKDLKTSMDAVEWAKTTKSIGDGLSSNLIRAVKDGKDIWLTMRDYMVGVILDGMLKNALSSIFSAALQGFDSMLGGIVSSAMSKMAGSAGGSAIGSAASSAAGGAAGGSAIGSIGAGAGGAAIGSTITGAGSTVGGVTVLGTNIGGTSMAASGGAFEAALASSGAGVTGAAVTTGVEVGGAVTTGVEVGGAMSTGMPVATELGMLGETGAVTTGTTAAAGSSTTLASLGPAAAALLAVDIISGGQIGKMVGGILDGSFFSGAGTTADEWAAAAPSARAREGLPSWAPYFATNAEMEQWKKDNGWPGYATGGDHPGGLRIVGENGPELEATGPSRIFDAATTASMLRSGGASNDEVVAELRLLRASVERNTEYAASQANSLQGRGAPPLRVQVVTA